MHIIHNTIWIPKITHEKVNVNESIFTIGPLPNGFWITIWNSIRRVLLSSIPWARVTWIKVRWISHEYSTIPWIKDSVLDIMLNLKWLIIDKNDSGIEWVSLKKNKAWIVTAWDIKTSSSIKIINPELYITEIDKNWLELNLEIRIEKWIWYFSIEELKKREDDVQVLIIDANFSPVLNVKYDISTCRFWDITNLDSLELCIKTNWIISPKDALTFSTDMLKSYFSMFNETWLQIEWEFIWDIKKLIEKEKAEIKVELEKETYTPIEIMWLSPRTLNALVNWEILSIEHLAKCTEAKLSSIKWFWKKAMTEVRKSLKERWVKLLWDD
jgi:DNA-directed RNA polymerase subunit alpha